MSNSHIINSLCFFANSSFLSSLFNDISMFFSPEILTSRNSGFSTAWLMATLGSKPSSNKINKSEIMATPVSKVCSMIETPPGPLALRLSSQLLYGVSLIYQQQITYLLTDVSLIRTKLLHDQVAKPSDLFAINLPSRNRVRNELANDPAFSLDFFILPPGPLLPSLSMKDAVPNLAAMVKSTGTQIGNYSLAEITLPNESIENPVEARDFLTSFMYDKDLDVENVEFGFGEDGEIIEDTSSSNGEINTMSEFNYDLPEHADNEFELGIQNADAGVYQFNSEGDLELGLDELRASAWAGQRLEEGDAFARESIPTILASATKATPDSALGKRACPFDPHINVAIEDLRSFRDNYSENMLAAKHRRVSRQTKKQPLYTFNEFTRLAIGPTFSNIFKRTLGANLPVPGRIEDRLRGKTPEDIEFGREGGHRHSEQRFSSSPVSIPVSERMRGSSSPNIRSSRFLPSDLGDIPEISSHSFGYDDVYNEDLSYNDLEVTDFPPLQVESAENSDEEDIKSDTGKSTRRIDSTSKFMAHFRSVSQQIPSTLLKDAEGYVLYDSVFPAYDTTKAQAASAFAQILKMTTQNKMKLKHVAGSGSGIWMLI